MQNVGRLFQQAIFHSTHVLHREQSTWEIKVHFFFRSLDVRTFVNMLCVLTLTKHVRIPLLPKIFKEVPCPFKLGLTYVHRLEMQVRL